MQHETVGQIFKMMYDFIKIHELKLQLLFQKIRCPPQAVSSHLVQILLCDITCVSNLSQLIKPVYYHFAPMLHPDKWSVLNANLCVFF